MLRLTTNYQELNLVKIFKNSQNNIQSNDINSKQHEMLMFI